MIVILDYRAGNLRSVAKALETVGESPVITDDPAIIAQADGLVVPGQGSAVDAIVIRGCALDSIYASLGDGDDHLSLVTTRVLQPFVIDGGVGANDVLHTYGSAIYYLGTPGFEHKTSNWPWWLTM